MTPSVALSVPALFLFPTLYTMMFGTESSTYARQYTLAAETAQLVVPALVYRWIKTPAIGCRGKRPEVRIGHWLVLFFAIAVFLPVLIQFHAYLLDPREIYLKTRRGFGITFFGSAMLLNIAGALFFFRKEKNRIADVLFWLLVVALSLEHGSKGELVQFVWFWILFRVYVDDRPFRLGEAVRFIAVGGALACTAFVFLGIAEPGDIIQGFAKYADYNRTAALVIDDPDHPVYFGLITVENEIYSRIPRAIFPSKPTVYGSYILTRRYFPASAWRDVGSPDFGVGIQYADFGPFAIVYIAMFAAFGGWATSCVVRRIRTDPNPGNLLLLAFFSGIQLIPLGAGYLLPESLVLAFGVQAVLRLPKFRLLPRIRPSLSEASVDASRDRLHT
ncbi:MAG TPA: hypothetical protein DGA22_00295 [Acidobacterium sp.]|nr:hypothetical protein [Acidobacterium sp.]